MSRIDQKAPAQRSGGVGPDVGKSMQTSENELEGVSSLDELAAPDDGVTAADVATFATVAGGALGAVEKGDDLRALTSGAKQLSPGGARWVGGGLNVVGAVATGADKLESSSAQTVVGKVADGVASGGLAMALGNHPVTGAFLAVDALTEKAIERSVQAVAGDDDVKAKVGFGTFLNASVTAYTVLAEMSLTDEESAGRDFVKRAKEGDYGMIMEGYVWIGDEVLDATPLIDAGFNLYESFGD